MARAHTCSRSIRSHPLLPAKNRDNTRTHISQMHGQSYSWAWNRPSSRQCACCVVAVFYNSFKPRRAEEACLLTLPMHGTLPSHAGQVTLKTLPAPTLTSTLPPVVEMVGSAAVAAAHMSRRVRATRPRMRKDTML